MKDRIELVAPCGLDCGICELYTCKDDQKLFAYLVSTGIPEQVLPCRGCKPLDGKCPVQPGDCATYECAKSKGFDYCSQCDDFPCMMLAPARDRAEVLPHNTKVFNLCTIKREGVEAVISKAQHIKDSYYAGKMVVGRGPVLEKD